MKMIKKIIVTILLSLSLAVTYYFNRCICDK